MRKSLLLVLCVALFVAGCSGVNTPVPIPTAILSTPTVALSPTIVATGQPFSEIKLETQTGTSYTLDWSSDGNTLAVASGFEVSFLSNNLKNTIAILKPDGGALGISWSPDRTQLATINGLHNPMIMLWDWKSESQQLTLKQQIPAGSDQYAVSWSPNGKLLATLGNDRQAVIQIWDTGIWKEIHRYELDYVNPRRALNWNEDSNTIYDAGEKEGRVAMFALNVSDGTVHDLAKTPTEQASAFAITSDEQKIAIAGSDGRVLVFNPSTGQLVTQFHSVGQPVDMAWDPNGTTLAILDYKTTLQLWKIEP